MEVSIFPRNLVFHRTFKGMAVDQGHSELLGVVGEIVTSKLLDQTTPTSISFIGSRGNPYATHPCQQTHIPSVHNHNISHHNNAPMIHASFFSHAFNSSCFTFVCLSLLLPGLHGSLIQPLWLWSILIGCSTHLLFSKKCPYWMVLMPVYVETAEGLVKPLVILPAAIMPLSSFILVFSWHHHPLCSCWFILFSQPTMSLFHLINLSHALFFYCSSSYYYVREHLLFMAEQCS